MTTATSFRIDGMQYSNWSRPVFETLRQARLDAIHVTIAYHENFREMVANVERWNGWFEQFPNLICKAKTAEDVRQARREQRTAVIFGFQNPSPLEDDIRLIEIVHDLGARFMQLTYNYQSLLASGCYEKTDGGVTHMGKEVIREMNRVGLVIDMSHSGERSTLEAIDLSSRPIAITHANPHAWEPALRNKSDTVIKALAARGGMLGFSLYPHHLKHKSQCAVEDFCAMVAHTADLVGIENLGIGSDLCLDQPDSVVQWMRNGRRTKVTDYGEGSAAQPGFPPQPSWFRDSRGFSSLERGLREIGFSATEINAVLGNNWLRFFEANFVPETTRLQEARAKSSGE